MRRIARLTAVQNCILEQLARVQFATNKQFMFWCGVNATSISTSVRGLLDSGLIDGSLFSRPQLFHLTSAGARLVNVHMPAGGRHASWSVMAHACHLNDFEISFHGMQGWNDIRHVGMNQFRVRTQQIFFKRHVCYYISVGR